MHLHAALAGGNVDRTRLRALLLCSSDVERPLTANSSEAEGEGNASVRQ